MFAKQRMELVKKLGLKLPVLMTSRTSSIRDCKNFAGQAHLLDIAIDKYSVWGETEDETRWEKDMNKMVNILDLIFGNIGPGILCDLVDQVLN